MPTHTTIGELLQGRVRVALAGAGGNGSHMLAGLARLDRSLRALGHPGGLQVTVYDPDRVAESNVGRQLFYPGDVGQSKAICLVHRLNLAYGLAWHAVPGPYANTGASRAEGPRAHLVISCVDSAAARREIWREVRERSDASPFYWLDLGNRQQDGQVILGQPVRYKPRRETNVGPRLPTVMELHPELQDETLPEDNRPSCSLAEALASQDLFVNQVLTSWALQLLWRLFRAGQIEHHGYYVNLASGRVNPVPVPAERGEKQPEKKPAKKPRAREAVAA